MEWKGIFTRYLSATFPSLYRHVVLAMTLSWRRNQCRLPGASGYLHVEAFCKNVGKWQDFMNE